MSEIRDSHEYDPALLAPNLRKADIEEIEAASHLTPFEVLYTGYYLGRPCRTFIGDSGRVVGMYGITPIPNTSEGVIWCLTTPELFTIKKYFMRNCRDEIISMCEGYTRVYNYVYEKNARHIRWIKAMGFNMDESPTPFGRYNKPFYYFEKVITNV